MAQKIFTAPMGILRVPTENGLITVARVKNISAMERIDRTPVYELGTLNPVEDPAIGWMGTLSCEFHCIDLQTSQIPGAIDRSAKTVEEWANFLIFQETGVQLDVLRKKNDGTTELFVTIYNLFARSQGFNMPTQSLVGTTQEFDYLTPIFGVQS